MQWVCVRECFKYSTLFHIGDIIQSDEPQAPHFVPLEGLEGSIPVSGRKFLVENNQITGVWDG